MTIAIACDHAAYELKEQIKEFLCGKGFAVKDFGLLSPDPAADYPDFALPASEAVASGECEKGILICGTGVGMSLCANKVKGVRCALCADVFTAEATRQHNDSNMLALGSRVISGGLAVEIVDKFLSTPFSDAERHIRRISKITEIENKYSK